MATSRSQPISRGVRIWALCILVALTAVIVMGGVTIVGNDDSETQRNDTLPSLPEIRKDSMSEDQEREQSTIPGGAPRQETESESLLPEEEQRIKDWARERGFSPEYNRYFMNEEFLKNQALSGDMLAAQLLGYQQLGSEEGERYLTDAARWGSIQALLFLSASHEARVDGRVEMSAKDAAEVQRAYSLSALAYLFVAEIRGDNYAAANSIERLLDRISYTEQDIQESCQKARAVYSKLEDSRRAEGLGPFDNSFAPGVRASTRFSEWCD